MSLSCKKSVLVASVFISLTLSLPIKAKELLSSLSDLEKAIICKNNKTENSIIKNMIKNGKLSKYGYAMDYSISYFPLKHITIFGGKLLTVTSDNSENTNGRWVGCCPNNLIRVLAERPDINIIKSFVKSDKRVFIRTEVDGLEEFKELIINDKINKNIRKAIPKWFTNINKLNVVEIECHYDISR